MSKNIKLFISIIFISIILLTNSKAELTNKVVMSVGNQIITDYDISREIKYLTIVTVGNFKNLGNKEGKKIAIDSLIKDKIKTNEIKKHSNINVNKEMVDQQILRSIRDIGFKNIEAFKTYLKIEKYTFKEFKEKIKLELKWNQLVYQFYKNQIVINKDKIDSKLKKIVSGRQQEVEYLIYEIFIENSLIKKENEISENESKEIVIKEKSEYQHNGIIIEIENVSYDGEKSNKDMKKTQKDKKQTKIKNKITIVDLMLNIKKNGFENTAAEFSSSPSSKQGGNLGWINQNEFSSLLIKSIKNTKIGNITKPIPVPGGILILKISDKRILEDKFDIDKKMKELVSIEKNIQLTQFSSNYFQQVKNNIKIKDFNE